MTIAGTWGYRRNHRSSPRLLHRALPTAMALAFAATFPSHALAFDLEYDIGAELAYSDNIDLSETAPQDDTLLTPKLRFDVSQAGSKVRISGHGQLHYNDYLDDTFKDELRGGFSGGLDWTILPTRLDLVFQDYLSLQPIDDLERSSPNNLQQVNLFVAGPSFYARFNPSTRGQFDLRYGNTYAEDSESFNGDRFSAAVRVRHEISPTAEITGNLEAARIEYDPAGSTANYERYDAYLSQALRRPAFDFKLDLGYSQLDLAAGNGRSSPLVRGAATWTLSERSRLRADLRYQFTDATQYLLTPTLDFGDRSFSDIAYTDIIVEPNVFRESSVRVAYQFGGARTSMKLQPYYRRIENLSTLAAVQSLDDQTLKGLAFGLEHRFRPLLSMSLIALHERRHYDVVSRTDKDTTIDVGLTKRFTRHWSASVGVRYRERDSSAPEQGYEENFARLSITYTR